MSGIVRAGFVVAVVAAATIGEGGASAGSLLAQHLLIAAGVAVALLALPPSASVPTKAASTAWLAFALLAAAGAATAPYAYAAWLVMVEIVAFGAVAWLAAGSPSVLSKVLPTAVAVLASIHGALAVVQWISGAPRPASTFHNANHLGAWLAAAVLVLAGRITDHGAGTRSRAAYGAAAAVALAGIFVTGSRGAVVGLAAGATAFVALAWSALSAKARRHLVAGACAATLVVGAGVVVRFRADDDPYRFHRTRIWAASLGAVAEAPWRGTGPGQFAAAAANLNFPLENTPLRYERSFRTPHSDVLRAVCEFGIPAGLAAFAAAALFVLSVLRRRGHLSAIERGAFAALVGLGAQACVDDLSTRPALTLLGAALAGLLATAPRAVPATRLARAGAVTAALLMLACFAPGEVAGFVAWREAGLGRVRSAVAWNPMQPDSWRRLAQGSVGDGRAWSTADYAAAREAAEHACRLQPVDAVYAREAARVEAQACLSILPFAAVRDRAAELYVHAGVLARTDATIPLEAAKFLLQAGDPAGARRAAEAALRVEPRAAVPRVWLAQALLTQDGRAGAARAKALLDEALALALPPGVHPTSAYDASLRAVDPALVAAVRKALDALAVP